MGLRQPSYGILRATPVRTAAHVSLATLAALIVVPVCAAKSTTVAGGPSAMARAARCVLPVAPISFDPAPECFADAPPATGPVLWCPAASRRVAEPLIRTFVTIARIGSRHGP